MAKTSTVDLFKQRLEEVTSDMDKAVADLQKLQDKLRPEPGNKALRATVQKGKAEVYKLNDEKCDLQRAIAGASGGKNYVPPAG